MFAKCTFLKWSKNEALSEKGKKLALNDWNNYREENDFENDSIGTAEAVNEDTAIVPEKHLDKKPNKYIY